MIKPMYLIFSKEEERQAKKIKKKAESQGFSIIGQGACSSNYRDIKCISEYISDYSKRNSLSQLFIGATQKSKGVFSVSRLVAQNIGVTPIIVYF
jgi:hypothetical protein